MCLFALPVREVASTNIFANMHWHAPGLLRQTLIYEARVVTEQPNAIVLPIPVHPRVGVAGISLSDLSAIPDFFPRLVDLIGPPPGFSAPAALGFGPPALSVLPVHRVGSFHVSIVPTIDDFHRLSGIFSLAFRTLETVLRRYYADHAFVVYQFAPGSAVLHPFGLSFVTRYAQLYFPTLHVHDGTSPARASFDHQLFAQRSRLPEKGRRPVDHPDWSMRILPRTPFIDGKDVINTGGLRGIMLNQDTFVENDPEWLRTLDGPIDCTLPPATVPPSFVPFSSMSIHEPPPPAPERPQASCSNCGWILFEGALFCSMCGRPTRGAAAPRPTPLTGAQTPCSKCGWMLSATASLCDLCGHPARPGARNTFPAILDYQTILILVGIFVLVVVLLILTFMGVLPMRASLETMAPGPR